jgi:hypothetical protein
MTQPPRYQPRGEVFEGGKSLFDGEEEDEDEKEEEDEEDREEEDEKEEEEGKEEEEEDEEEKEEEKEDEKEEEKEWENEVMNLEGGGLTPFDLELKGGGHAKDYGDTKGTDFEIDVFMK